MEVSPQEDIWPAKQLSGVGLQGEPETPTLLSSWGSSHIVYVNLTVSKPLMSFPEIPDASGILKCDPNYSP